jgi:hypothetical protein
MAKPMTLVTFFFIGHTETHRLVGLWTREDLRQRAKDMGAVAWE